MDGLADHVRLIRDGVGGGTTWADLGSGIGAFTLALAELLGPGATIHSVDRDSRALEQQSSAIRRRFQSVELDAVVADFTKPLDLPTLDAWSWRTRCPSRATRAGRVKLSKYGSLEAL